MNTSSHRGHMKAHVLATLCIVLSTMLAACDMDSFLFNTEELDRYHPPSSIPGSALEQLTFKSGEHTLYGFWIKSDGRRPGSTIIYCHGNKHNMDEYWDRIEFLRALGMNIFTFDYRGFGLSEGTSTQDGMYADAEAALSLVQARGYDGDSLVLYGYSLGNVASIHLASMMVRPRALVVESGFASSTSLVQGATVLDFQARWLTDGTFDNAAAIATITAPVLVLHGEEDDFVRFRDNGQVIFDNAGDPKLLVAVPGATHTDVPQKMGVPAYLEIVGDWIE